MNDLLDVIRGIKATIGANHNHNHNHNHRFKSWEHCYKFFKTFLDSDPKEGKRDRDLACLHLAFYLASWGMLRNSFLLEKDYKYHEHLIEIIEDSEITQNIEYTFDDNDKIWNLITRIRNEAYPGNTPTPTLITKILLGTLGCMPAYDDYFRAGIRQEPYGLSCTLSARNFKNEFSKFIELARDNQEQLAQARCILRTEEHNFDYLDMKIIDMYFWEKGRPQ